MRLIRAAAVLTLAATVAACAKDGDTNADTSAPAGGAAARSATGADSAARGMPNAFALLRGSDTISIERFGRSGDTLRGELRDASNGNRVTYRAAIGPNNLVRRFELSLWEKDATDPKTQLMAELRGDSLIAEQREGGNTKTDRVSVPTGTLFYFNPSIAMMEQVLRRAKEVGGQQVELPVFTISTQHDPRMDRPTVRWIGPDSAEVVLDRNNRLKVAVGEDGRILGGENADKVQVRRLP